MAMVFTMVMVIFNCNFPQISHALYQMPMMMVLMIILISMSKITATTYALTMNPAKTLQ